MNPRQGSAAVACATPKSAGDLEKAKQQFISGAHRSLRQASRIHRVPYAALLAAAHRERWGAQARLRRDRAELERACAGAENAAEQLLAMLRGAASPEHLEASAVTMARCASALQSAAHWVVVSQREAALPS